MIRPKDNTSASTQFKFDVNKSPLFQKDRFNFINVVGVEQLNSLQNTSLLDIHLSKNNVVEPHYHQHASEFIYCISGAVIIAMLNPKTKKLHEYPITSGQVVNVPQGWWHYIIATADDSHFLGIFDEPQPQVVLGSDLLKLTPSNVMAHTYCMNEQQWNEAIRPVQPATFIGPPADCYHGMVHESAENRQPVDHMHPYTKRK